MSQEEVKIEVSAETSAAQRKISELNESIRKMESERDRLNQRAATVEESGGDKPTRDKINALRTEAQRYEKAGMDAAAKTHRASAAKLEKEVDTGIASQAQEARAAAAKHDQNILRARKEIGVLEKEITSERRTQTRESEAAEKLEETRRTRFGRTMIGGGRGVAGGLVGGGAAYVLEQAFTEYTERQGIALRASARRTMDERGLAIAGSWRGSSSQTLAQQQQLTDSISQQVANRPELERKANAGIFMNAVGGGLAGMSVGFMGSGGNPIAAGIGLVSGAAAGAYKGYQEGEREKDEDKLSLANKRKLRQELEALGNKQVREEDGQIQMDIARHRSERTMSGSRALVVDEAKETFLHRYRELSGMKIGDEEANQTAGLEAETRMRDRQIAAGSGLVDARSGAGDIAAAARWGAMSTPGMGEVKTAIEALHGTVKANSEAITRLDLSVQ